MKFLKSETGRKTRLTSPHLSGLSSIQKAFLRQISEAYVISSFYFHFGFAKTQVRNLI